MTTRPFMQLYIADYLGDTQHLTTEQHGAYLLLLMAMWKAGGELPNDEETLKTITRADSKRWPYIARAVLPFFTIDGDSIAQKRLAREIKRREAVSSQQRAASQQGVLARALKRAGLYQPSGQLPGSPGSTPKRRPGGTSSGQPPGSPPGQPSHKEKEILSSDGEEHGRSLATALPEGRASLTATPPSGPETPNDSPPPARRKPAAPPVEVSDQLTTLVRKKWGRR
jgi:uncharacterized protein YdaU (DUF1376 family)